jgi:threonine/homoserine/homoserine lactone efflux protein
MNALVSGFGVALIVSLLPGPNTALLVDSTREGMAQTIPVVTGAAITDGTYAVLACPGVLAVQGVNTTMVHWRTALSCLAAATVLSVPRRHALSGRMAMSLALLNPSTAVLWIALSTLPVTHPQGMNIAFWTLGVMSGTTCWFLLLAYVSTRTHGRTTETRGRAARRLLAIALVIGGILAVV